MPKRRHPIPLQSIRALPTERTPRSRPPFPLRRLCPPPLPRRLTRRSRHLADVDRSVPPPANAGEPRSRDGDRRAPSRPGDGASPAVEPARRRSRIETSRAANVLPPVLQDVLEGVSHLARRGECVRVISVGEDGATSPERAVHGLRDADGKPLEPARETRRLVRLHHQVHMIHLNRELDDTKPLPRRVGERVAHARKEPRAAQRRNTPRRAKGDVRGTPGRVRRATPMWNAGPATRRRLTTRAVAAATPRREFELLGTHLD
jgi:hypothetical protein